MAGFRRTLDDLRVHRDPDAQDRRTSATESGANVFRLDYFGRPAYLAQSPQFYKQTLVGAFERVYEVGPVFRAEPHDTVRHLAEYVSLDAELGFIEDHRDVMRVLRDVVAGHGRGHPCSAPRLPSSASELDSPRCRPRSRRCTSPRRRRLIGAATGDDLSGEPDLAPAHEQWLGEWARREHGSDFLFVPGYPMAKRPFYTHPEPGAAASSRTASTCCSAAWSW